MESKKIKIFIPQPMAGIPDRMVELIRAKVTAIMIERYGENVEIIDQFHIPKNDMPSEGLKNPRIDMLGRSIRYMADADLVVFVGDFLHSKGCMVELAVCKEYGIKYECINFNELKNEHSLKKYTCFCCDNNISDGKIFVSDIEPDVDVLIMSYPILRYEQIIKLKTSSGTKPFVFAHMSDDELFVIINNETAREMGLDYGVQSINLIKL